jgi:hypothetical protein
MKSAPLILLVEIVSSELTGDMRMLGKSPETGGPMVPEIPLHLARIQAKVLIAVRGSASQVVEFYSWVWASGSHGGPRLFHPTPGGGRVVFLRPEGGYLHTVGDYPAYDLEVPHSLVPRLVDLWNSGQESGDALERLVALRIRADFEDRSFTPSLKAADLSRYSARIDGFADLMELRGPLFIASQFDKTCRGLTNPFGRIAACFELAREFPRRCEAYRLAADLPHLEGLVAGLVSKCTAAGEYWLENLREGKLPQYYFADLNSSADHRREAMRVWASALDREVRDAACKLAVTMWEARDIPECSSGNFR